MFTNKHMLGIGCTLLMGNCVGCAGAQTGHLYNMKTGQSAAVQVESAGSPSSGRVKAKMPDGSLCEGQFSRVSVENARQISSAAPTLTENSWASVAVMNCGPNRVIQCTLASREWSQFSYGECQDQSGTNYSLVF